MKNILLLLTIIFLSACSSGQNADNKNIIKTTDTMEFNILTPFEMSVINNKGTEQAFTGKYDKFKEKGTYLCKKCNAPLYRSSDKFDGHCGWPSFDDEIEGAVIQKPDADGRRVEIICANCGAHLGHVFWGEGFTPKDTRHCVNSISLNFVPVDIEQPVKLERAIYAGGCFWGVEYYLQKQKGVISTTVGYIGGTKPNPTYEDVCSHTSGYAEAVEVYFNPEIISYEELTKLFFEIHDPTQINRQGPDVGDQYRSEIFYVNLKQKEIDQKLITELEDKGFKVQTKLELATEFYPAENYHQDYYQHKGGTPYCHVRVKKF